MEFPICKVCLKNDILCQACSTLIRQEKIPEDEIKTYRELHKLFKKEDHLQDIKIKRIFGNQNFSLIVTTKDDVSKVIGKNGIVVKKLSKHMNKQIRVVSDTSDIKDVAKEVFFSATILGINVLYTPDGEKIRIRVLMPNRATLPVEPAVFSNIANSIFNNDVELVFE